MRIHRSIYKAAFGVPRSGGGLRPERTVVTTWLTLPSLASRQLLPNRRDPRLFFGGYEHETPPREAFGQPGLRAGRPLSRRRHDSTIVPSSNPNAFPRRVSASSRRAGGGRCMRTCRAGLRRGDGSDRVKQKTLEQSLWTCRECVRRCRERLDRS